MSRKLALKGVLIVQVLLVTLLASGNARGQNLEDPPLLRITPLGCDFACYVGPTSPVPITSAGFDLTYISDGVSHGSLVDPVLLILGIPGSFAGTASGVAPTLTSSDATVTLGGTNQYGGTWNTSTGFAGNFDASSNSRAYDRVGFAPGGSPSQNYANWTMHAPGVTSWGLFVYSLTFSSPFSVGNSIQLFANSGLPTNTYVMAYGCDQVVAGRCSAIQDTFSTPFTYAGLNTTSVSEPSLSTLLLVNFGVLCFFAWRLQRGRPQASKAVI